VPAGDAGGEAYEFVHDRVQQAAYEALTEEQRIETHHALAGAIEQIHTEATGHTELFAMLHHHLRSLSRLVTVAQKHHVGALWLQGGRRGKAGSAPVEAAELLRAGQALLGANGWDEAFTMTFETHLALAEACWLAGEVEVGEALCHLCMERALDKVSRARVA